MQHERRAWLTTSLDDFYDSTPRHPHRWSLRVFPLSGRLRYRGFLHISTMCELLDCVHGSRSSGIGTIDDKAHSITACEKSFVY